MKKNSVRNIIMAVAVVLAPWGMSSCDNEDNWAAEQVVIKGEGISNKMGVVELGQTLQLKAVRNFVVHGSGLQWESSDPTVATVDQNGLLTPLKVGTVVITVRTTGAEQSDAGEITVDVVDIGFGLADDLIDQSEAE